MPLFYPYKPYALGTSQLNHCSWYQHNFHWCRNVLILLLIVEGLWHKVFARDKQDDWIIHINPGSKWIDLIDVEIGIFYKIKLFQNTNRIVSVQPSCDNWGSKSYTCYVHRRSIWVLIRDPILLSLTVLLFSEQFIIFNHKTLDLLLWYFVMLMRLYT